MRSQIDAATFTMNKTFSGGQKYNTDLGRFKRTVGYIAQQGLFTFDMDTQKATPLLLNARDNSVIYRYPILLDDGTVFVQGLESTSGATGAEGPVFRVNAGL